MFASSSVITWSQPPGHMRGGLWSQSVPSHFPRELNGHFYPGCSEVDIAFSQALKNLGTVASRPFPHQITGSSQPGMPSGCPTLGRREKGCKSDLALRFTLGERRPRGALTCPESLGICTPQSRCWTPLDHLLTEGKPPPPSYQGSQFAWPGRWRHVLSPSRSIPTTLSPDALSKPRGAFLWEIGGWAHALPLLRAHSIDGEKGVQVLSMEESGRGETPTHQWKTRGVKSAHVTLSVGPMSSPTDLVVFFITL